MCTNRVLDLRTEEFECLTSYQPFSDLILTVFDFDSQRPKLRGAFNIFALCKKNTYILL